MAQSNGTAAAVTAAGQVPTGIAGVSMAFTPERIQELLAALSEPFDPELVEWRVTNTAPGKHGSRGQVVAYADQRAYTDRLNELFTPLGWTREYAVQTAQNFEVPVRGKEKTTVISAKVMVTCKVTIYGMGTHSGTGEEWATDENALTRAEAQAFKRACSCFGLGRYFYDLPRTWVDLDEHKRPLELPRLPDWALPKERNASASPRRQANRPTASGTPTGAERSPSGDQGRAAPGSERRKNGRLYGEDLRQTVQALSEEVGFSLTRFVVHSVAGKEDLGAVQNNAHLTSVMEKLTDLARGVRRLKAAVEKAGDSAYANVCRELNLASESIDDIPNREVLRQLVARMEAAASSAGKRNPTDARSTSSGGAASNGNGNGIPFDPAANGSEGSGIVQLRERLLVEARRASTALRKGIGDMIAAASQGSFGFADLTKLTDDDCAKVEAALKELRRMAV